DRRPGDRDVDVAQGERAVRVSQEQGEVVPASRHHGVRAAVTVDVADGDPRGFGRAAVLHAGEAAGAVAEEAHDPAGDGELAHHEVELAVTVHVAGREPGAAALHLERDGRGERAVATTAQHGEPVAGAAGDGEVEVVVPVEVDGDHRVGGGVDRQRRAR